MFAGDRKRTPRPPLFFQTSVLTVEKVSLQTSSCTTLALAGRVDGLPFLR